MAGPVCGCGKDEGEGGRNRLGSSGWPAVAVVDLLTYGGGGEGGTT